MVVYHYFILWLKEDYKIQLDEEYNMELEEKMANIVRNSSRMCLPDRWIIPLSTSSCAGTITLTR